MRSLLLFIAGSVGTILVIGLISTAAFGRDKPDKVVAPLQGEARAEFLGRVEKRMAGVRSVVARFEQEKKLAILKKPLRTHGVILFARPDRLRWEIREPFRSTLIVAGDRVAKFEEVDGERKKLELGRRADVIATVMDRIRAWFLGRFDPDSREYHVGVHAEPSPKIVFTPKGAALGKNLKSIVLDLSRELDRIAAVTIHEKNGDRTHMAFALVAQDVTLSPELFSSDDPTEVDLKELERVARDSRCRPKSSSPNSPEKRR